MAEVDIAHGKSFIDNQEFRIHMYRNRESEANEHTAGIGFDRLINKLTNFGESLNGWHALPDVIVREAQEASVQDYVFPAGELRVEAGAQLEEGRQFPVHCKTSLSWGEDASDELEECAFAGTILADDAKGFAF
jgi:hypothetical protein